MYLYFPDTPPTIHYSYPCPTALHVFPLVHSSSYRGITSCTHQNKALLSCQRLLPFDNNFPPSTWPCSSVMNIVGFNWRSPHDMPMQAQRGETEVCFQIIRNLALGKRRVVCTAAALPSGKNGTHCTGGWVDLGAGLGVTGNFAHTWLRSPDRLVHRESL